MIKEKRSLEPDVICYGYDFNAWNNLISIHIHLCANGRLTHNIVTSVTSLLKFIR